MFERFTDRARRVLVLAQEEARLLDHRYIGTEHLLLGLVHEDEGVAAQALRSLGISLEAVREKVAETIGMAATAPRGSPPFTPRAKKVLELSLREAMQLGHSYISSEHLLLGLVREGEGVGAQVLVSLGADLGRVRQQVVQLVSGQEVIQHVSGHQGTEASGPPDLLRPQVTRFGQQGMRGARPPWRRCALCGRSLWETAHVVVGTRGRACEECVRAGAQLLEGAAAETRELVLPPRVSGQPPDATAVAAIVAAVHGAFGPDANRSTWETTIEEPERFGPLLQQAGQRWGSSEAVHVTEVGFVTPELAYVRLRIVLPRGNETTVSGQLRQHDDRWLVTGETLLAVLHLAGVPTDDRSAEAVTAGVPPDDRAVEEVTRAVTKVFGGDRQPGDQAAHLEDADALAPYLQQADARMPETVRRLWEARVERIRFTGPDTAGVTFAVEWAGRGPTFQGTVRRHGERWMVTRDTMVAVLARGGIVVPPPDS